MNRHAGYFRPLMLLIVVWPLAACVAPITPSLGPVEGHVRDVGTQQPIPDALVVALWHGHSPVFPADGQSVCYHTETTITDANGRYRFPAFAEEPRHQRIQYKYMEVRAYRPAYEETRTQPEKGVIYLKPSTLSRGERLKYLLHLSGLASCYGAGNEKAAYPLYKGLYDEAKQIAETVEEKDAMKTIRRRAALAWVRTEAALTSREVESLISNDPYLKEQLK